MERSGLAPLGEQLRVLHEARGVSTAGASVARGPREETQRVTRRSAPLRSRKASSNPSASARIRICKAESFAREGVLRERMPGPTDIVPVCFTAATGRDRDRARRAGSSRLGQAGSPPRRPTEKLSGPRTAPGGGTGASGNNNSQIEGNSRIYLQYIDRRIACSRSASPPDQRRCATALSQPG